MSEATIISSTIRQSIKPFRHERVFQTGWAGELSFAEIHANLIPNMNRLLRYYRKPVAYIPDMLQEGFMRLWWDLCQEPTMLADANKGDALRMVLDRTRIPSFVRKSYSREVYLKDLATRSGDPDEFVIEGYEGRFFTEHSEFSRAVDIRIDFECVIQHMAEKYMDSLPHLVALYYITTDVSVKDAAELAGRGGSKQAWWQTRIVKPMKEELAELLQIFVPTKLNWKKKFVAGDEGPFWQVVDKFKGRQSHRMVEVMCGMAEHENCKSMASRLDLPLHMIHMYRRKAHEELRKAYRCSA